MTANTTPVALAERLWLFMFPSWVNRFRYETADCRSILDLGCGVSSPIHYLNVPYSLGVEIHLPYLVECRERKLHSQYILADITRLELKPKSFDAVIATQVLEHLTKEEGFDLLHKMEEMARKKVIITVPNGHVFQDDVDGNPFQCHKSAWNASELATLGFRAYGMSGWRALRGYRGEVKYRPSFIWRRISDFTQIATYHFPQWAFQIFAVKSIDTSVRGEA